MALNVNTIMRKRAGQLNAQRVGHQSNRRHNTERLDLESGDVRTRKDLVSHYNPFGTDPTSHSEEDLPFLDEEGIQIDIYSVYLHVYPLILFLALVATTTIVLLFHKSSSIPIYSLFLLSFQLFIGQIYLVPYSNSSTCIHAISWFWALWLVYGTLWSNRNVLHAEVYGVSDDATYWVVSTIQCLLGIDAHIVHSRKSNTTNTDDFLILFGKRTPITRHTVSFSLSLLYAYMFIFFPHQSAIYSSLHAIEAFIRPVVMFVFMCATIAVHSCTKKKLVWHLLLRETSWICLTNRWCLISLVYFIFSLIIDASNCFSFIGNRIVIGNNKDVAETGQSEPTISIHRMNNETSNPRDSVSYLPCENLLEKPVNKEITRASQAIKTNRLIKTAIKATSLPCRHKKLSFKRNQHISDPRHTLQSLMDQSRDITPLLDV